jgi:hypothetical protein
MKFGIVLSCYDKVDDLLVHLDILKFNRLAPKIAVIYMHHDQPPVMPRGVELITMPSPGFSIWFSKTLMIGCLIMNLPIVG